MKTSLSIIIPTLGRESLKRALDSVMPQLGEKDEVIVVGDGVQPSALALCSGYPRVRYGQAGPTKCWGHEQRNAAMVVARGKHLAFLDDDDIWLKGARPLIDEGIRKNPEKLLFFRMQHRHGILWRTPEVLFGNISTQMYVFPNVQGKLARWRPRPEAVDGNGGDFLFARDTVGLWPPGSCVFLEGVISQLFHHSRGAL